MMCLDESCEKIIIIYVITLKNYEKKKKRIYFCSENKCEGKFNLIRTRKNKKLALIF